MLLFLVLVVYPSLKFYRVTCSYSSCLPVLVRSWSNCTIYCKHVYMYVIMHMMRVPLRSRGSQMMVSGSSSSTTSRASPTLPLLTREQVHSNFVTSHFSLVPSLSCVNIKTLRPNTMIQICTGPGMITFVGSETRLAVIFPCYTCINLGLP